jgi:hypothetical protein
VQIHQRPENTGAAPGAIPANVGRLGCSPVAHWLRHAQRLDTLRRRSPCPFCHPAACGHRKLRIHPPSSIPAAATRLDRATLADWVGKTAAVVSPLVEAVAQHVMAAEKLHADDTPVPVLAPGTGKTKTGRLWVYLRYERPYGGASPPAVVYRYSPDRKGEHPRAQLARFRGFLQADGYSGFGPLYETAKGKSATVDRGCVLGACAPQVLRHSCRDQRADRGRGAGADAPTCHFSEARSSDAPVIVGGLEQWEIAISSGIQKSLPAKSPFDCIFWQHRPHASASLFASPDTKCGLS